MEFDILPSTEFSYQNEKNKKEFEKKEPREKTFHLSVSGERNIHPQHIIYHPSTTHRRHFPSTLPEKIIYIYTASQVNHPH